MGLDFVSMVMEIQSEFGIEFDCDAKRSQTVGGLFDCIRDRMANAAVESNGPYAGRYGNGISTSSSVSSPSSGRG